MNLYSFAVPILPGKTDILKNYLKELSGPRAKEYDGSLQRFGIRAEHMWIQHIPQGGAPDMLIVMWDIDDPMRVFKQGFDSNDSYDQWFMQKVLGECLGMSGEMMKPESMPALNDHIVSRTMTTGEKQRVPAGKR